MKKKDIVKTHQEFNNIIKNGNKINSRFLVIYYINNDINHSRYGISVGTKLGNAVFRNKYKRKLRMIIHNNNNLYNECNDYIILLRKSATKLTYRELEQDFNKLVDRLKEN